MISKMFIKIPNGSVIFPDEQLDLPYTPQLKPSFGSVHNASSKPGSLPLRIDSHIVDPTAVTVLSNHSGGSNMPVDRSYQKG